MPPIRHVRIRIIIRTIILRSGLARTFVYNTVDESPTAVTVTYDESTMSVGDAEIVALAITALGTGDPTELNDALAAGDRAESVELCLAPAE